CLRVERSADAWQLMLEVRGRRDARTARALVNAAGPWGGRFEERMLQRPPSEALRLVKGSHIVVRRLFDHDRGYIFPTTDGRSVFALPFERDLTLVGTTDENFAGDPATVAPSSEEIGYLCDVVNDHFRKTIVPAGVVWSFAGVRSLHDDGSSKPQDTPRDYVLA